MKSLKSLFFTVVVMSFVLVWMSMSPMMQGMSLSVQLSYVANMTMQYLHQFLAPFIDFYYRHLG
jgi:hypothetical protein